MKNLLKVSALSLVAIMSLTAVSAFSEELAKPATPTEAIATDKAVTKKEVKEARKEARKARKDAHKDRAHQGK